MLKLETPIIDAPAQILPFTKAQADALDAQEQLRENCFTHQQPSVSQAYLKRMLPLCLLPALERLSFLGLAAADIRIEAEWIPQDAYADRPKMPAGMDEYTTDVSIAGFFTLFFILCVAVEGSTTAHRRFKHAFESQRLHIVLDARHNRAHLMMPPDIADALNLSFVAWTQTK